MKIWVVRWFNQGEWIEAFTTEELAMAHAWAIIRSLADDPDNLPVDLWDAKDEVEEDAELSVDGIIVHDTALPESRYLE